MARVYLDESGTPEAQGEVFVVGGVLLQGAIPDRIRHRWVDQFPGLPWPLHAAHFRVPASLAYAWAASGRSRPRPVQWAAAATRAVAVVEAMAATQHKKLVGLFRSGRWPRRGDYEVLLRVDGLMQATVARSDYDTLSAAADQVAGEVRSLILQLTNGALAPAGVVVLALEQTVGAAARRESGLPKDMGSRRYLRLLAAAVRAAAELQVPLEPVVMVRDIVDARRSRPVAPNDLAALLGGLRQIEPACVAAYDRRAPVEYVLADFVSNAARRALSERRRSVAATLGVLESEIGAMPAVAWVQ